MTTTNQALKTLGNYFNHPNQNPHEWHMTPYKDAYVVTPANNNRANPYIILNNKISILHPNQTLEEAYNKLAN